MDFFLSNFANRYDDKGLFFKDFFTQIKLYLDAKTIIKRNLTHVFIKNLKKKIEYVSLSPN